MTDLDVVTVSFFLAMITCQYFYSLDSVDSSLWICDLRDQERKVGARGNEKLGAGAVPRARHGILTSK